MTINALSEVAIEHLNQTAQDECRKVFASVWYAKLDFVHSHPNNPISGRATLVVNGYTYGLPIKASELDAMRLAGKCPHEALREVIRHACEHDRDPVPPLPPSPKSWSVPA